MNQTAKILKEKGKIKEIEFIALMAFLMSNVALSIDAILPALNDIGLSLEVANTSDLQLVIICIFLGLGLGELLFGTLSDSFGRKPIVYIGVVIFILASLLVVFAPSLNVLLLGRLIQGIGLSAVRSVCIAIIRDTYEGDRMARIMSFIMTVFVLVPMLAPLLGQTILQLYDWRAIFYFQLLFITITIVWFFLRQKETLVSDKRIPFTNYMFINGVTEFFKQNNSIYCTLVAGLLQGVFIAYLGSAQQIFQGQYLLIEEFPYIFGGLAFSFGLSTLLNGFFVEKFGMLKLVRRAINASIVCALIYLIVFPLDSNPEVIILIVFLLVQFFSFGFVFGNLSALALQPIGHIAGVGAAIFSFITMVVAVIVALFIGHYIRETASPLFVGFFLSGVTSLILVRFVKAS